MNLRRIRSLAWEVLVATVLCALAVVLTVIWSASIIVAFISLIEGWWVWFSVSFFIVALGLGCAAVYHKYTKSSTSETPDRI